MLWSLFPFQHTSLSSLMLLCWLREQPRGSVMPPRVLPPSVTIPPLHEDPEPCFPEEPRCLQTPSCISSWWIPKYVPRGTGPPAHRAAVCTWLELERTTGSASMEPPGFLQHSPTEAIKCRWSCSGGWRSSVGAERGRLGIGMSWAAEPHCCCCCCCQPSP